MNTPDNFDELSRRKLAEREFPFEEAHWADVQNALENRRKRRMSWLPWTAAGVLLVGGAMWWMTHDAQRPAEVAANGTAAGTAERQLSAEDTEVGPAIPRTDEGVDPVVVADNEPIEKATNATPQVVDVNPVRMADPVDTKRSGTKTGRSIAVVNDVVAEELPTVAVLETPIASEVVTHTQVDDSANTGTTDPETPAVETNGYDAKAPAPEPLVPLEQDALVAPRNTNDVVTQVEPVIGDELEPAATAALATIALDSLLSPVTPVAPLGAGSKPFLSFSVLGGAHNTTTHYSGGNSADWGNALSSVNAPTFGAELMRLGRNTGVGIGLHYTCYKERFNSDDRFRTDLEYRNTYFLDFIDTTVTIVVGIDTSSGDTAYITQQVTTTVSVLDSSTDTIATNTRTAEGRSHVNSVCYLEIPILFDAHITQGPWSFGVRGGPYFGWLTGRRGALPNAAWSDYTELADQPFSALTIGYMARAYVRYQFNAAWSVGIEPSYRGQIFNAYSSGDITRRSNAAGVLISLNYNLR